MGSLGMPAHHCLACRSSRAPGQAGGGGDQHGRRVHLQAATAAKSSLAAAAVPTAAMAAQTWSQWLQGLLSGLRPPPQPGSHEATLEQLRAGERALYSAPGRVHAKRGASQEFMRRRKCVQLPAAAPAERRPSGGVPRLASFVLLVHRLERRCAAQQRAQKAGGSARRGACVEAAHRLSNNPAQERAGGRWVGGGGAHWAGRSLLFSWVISPANRARRSQQYAST